MHETLTYRRLTAEDGPALAAFYNGLSAASKRTFRPLGETTTADICRQIGADNAGNTATKYDIVAVDGEAIVGWSFLWSLAAVDPEEGPVFGLAVADAYHGQGIGTALMRTVMDWADDHNLPQVILTVVQDNGVAQHLYRQQGFVRYGEFVGDDGLPYDRMRRERPES